MPTAGFLAGFAAGLALSYYASQPRFLLRLRLRLAALSGRTLILKNVHVPVALLPPASAQQLAPDAEGLVRCDVSISGGRIFSVDAAAAPSIASASIDFHGAVLMACWTDAHTHLVKTHAHPRTRNPTGSISDALAAELDDQPRWAACACCRPNAFACLDADDVDADTTPCHRATDVERRMEFALASAYHHGTRAIRTHLDGTNSPDAKLRATVYKAFSSCRERWSHKGLNVQVPYK